MTQYQPSNVSSKYGAPMGRGEPDCEPSAKLHLQRVRINSGGYDSGGAYWGLGDPLYVAFDDLGFETFVRATSRKEAKEKIKKAHPKAWFLV